MIDVSIDRQSMELIKKGLRDAETKLKKSHKQSLEWAGASIIGSLKARTRVSKKRRPIVENPDQTYKTDLRKARLGVMLWRKGKQVFSPIYKGGEFGQQIKYLERGNVLLKMPNGSWKKMKNSEISAYVKASGDKSADIRINNHPKTFVKRSGLAKASWGFMSKLLKRGGNAFAMGVSNVGAIVWRMGNTELRITNQLRYITDSLQGKSAAISAAVANGAIQFEKRVRLAVKEAGL